MLKKINTSTGIIIIFGLAVILFGGIYTYFNLFLPEINVSSDSLLTSAVDTTANWQTYTNNSYGYQIKLPKDWTVSAKGAADPANFVAPYFDSAGNYEKGQRHQQFYIDANSGCYKGQTLDKYFTDCISIGNSSTSTVKKLADTKIAGEDAIQFEQIANPNDPKYIKASLGYVLIYANQPFVIFYNESGQDLVGASDTTSWNNEFFQNIFKTFKFVDTTSSWETYNGSYEGISIRYPSTWKLAASNQAPSDYASANWRGPFDGFTLTSPNGFVITYQTHIDGIGGGCDEGVNCPQVFYKSVETLENANYQDLQLQQTEVREQDNKTVTARYVDLSGLIGDHDIIPKTGDTIEGFYAFFYHDKGVDKTLSRLSGEFKNNDNNNLSTTDFYNLPDVKQAVKIMRSVRFK